MHMKSLETICPRSCEAPQKKTDKPQIKKALLMSDTPGKLTFCTRICLSAQQIRKLVTSKEAKFARSNAQEQNLIDLSLIKKALLMSDTPGKLTFCTRICLSAQQIPKVSLPGV